MPKNIDWLGNIKFLLVQVGKLKSALDKNDQREVGKIIFQIENRLKKLHAALMPESEYPF
jgi:hypothetical protein